MNKHDAFYGALVADAAGMGLHWLYDQGQIRLLETTGSLLFRQPEGAVYEGKRGAFVHRVRRAGQLSHYGESARIAGLVALDEGYSIAAHQKAFMETFGPCGSFHGYPDKPTKYLIARMLLDGEDLKNPSGMEDDQMPAVCVVPGLFAADASVSETQDAAKVISTHADVLSSVKAVHSVLSQLMSGESLESALATAADSVEGELGEKMREALAIPHYAPLETAQHFGLACYVRHAMPLNWHLLKHATDFSSTVLDNIRCGGDCCGRSMALGSIAGLAFGVPDAMRRKATFSAVDVSNT